MKFEVGQTYSAKYRQNTYIFEVVNRTDNDITVQLLHHTIPTDAMLIYPSNHPYTATLSCIDDIECVYLTIKWSTFNRTGKARIRLLANSVVQL